MHSNLYYTAGNAPAASSAAAAAAADANRHLPSLCCPKSYAPKNKVLISPSLDNIENDCDCTTDDATSMDTQHVPMNTTTTSTSLFETIPQEVLRRVLVYTDIPSLSKLTQTSKAKSNATVSHLAADDCTWLGLVHRRFNISTNAGRMGPPRSKSYGGNSWKAAYRSMSMASRLPKCRAMPRKHVVFAKGTNRKTHSVSAWAMISHTDDCNTRIVSSSSVNDTSTSSSNAAGTAAAAAVVTDETENNTSVPRERFIELRLCLQNVKSGMVTANVDLSNIHVDVVGPNGISTVAAHTAHIIFRSNTCSEKENQSSLLNVTPRTSRHRAPTMISRSSRKHSRSSSIRSSQDDLDCLSTLLPITLHPFEFIVVSIRVPCTPEMRFETDFLSRARSLSVPVSCSNASSSSSASLKNTEAGCHNFDPCRLSFMHEAEIWEHYMQLPGSCLTLADRNHVISV